jgi:ribosomal protein S18 acetylase RimI-like enzyme
MLTLKETVSFATRDGLILTGRRLTLADSAALAAFNAGLGSESRRKFAPHRYDDETLAKILARSERGDDYTLGVFEGARIAAYLFLWYFNKNVPLLGIGMRDEYQHRGLGRPLMEHLTAAAREKGCEGVELTTMLDNQNAFALYEKCGFHYFGNVENKQGDGSVIVERGMFLPLKPGAKRMSDTHQPPV